MKLSDNYPIYLNPDFPELCELAKKSWDTIRVCTTETGNILLASGYGNTHNTILTYYRQYTGNRYEFLDCFILYKEAGIAYFNTEDIQGGREKDRRWAKYFSTEHEEILRDLIKESNLQA